MHMVIPLINLMFLYLNALMSFEQTMVSCSSSVAASGNRTWGLSTRWSPLGTTGRQLLLRDDASHCVYTQEPLASITPLVIPPLPHLPVEFYLSQLASLSSSVSVNLPPVIFLALYSSAATVSRRRFLASQTGFMCAFPVTYFKILSLHFLLKHSLSSGKNTEKATTTVLLSLMMPESLKYT